MLTGICLLAVGFFLIGFAFFYFLGRGFGLITSTFSKAHEMFSDPKADVTEADVSAGVKKAVGFGISFVVANVMLLAGIVTVIIGTVVTIAALV